MYNNIDEVPQEVQDKTNEIHKGIYKTEGKKLCMNCEYSREIFYKDGEKMIKLKHSLICLRNDRMTPEVYTCKEFQKINELPF